MSTDIGGLAHVNLRAPADLVERLRTFYRDVVGLADGPRPAFRSRGYWLYAGSRDVLHLSVATSPAGSSVVASSPTGWFDHIAFAGSDLAAALARLDAAGIDYELEQEPGRGAAQIFLRDPAGVGVELSFR